MKRSLADYEYEIVNQILIAEICFDVCKEIPITPGLGAHFYPYFFNLNMSKGILSLHSLLDSAGKELSIENYLSENKSVVSKRIGYQDFHGDVVRVIDRFQKITPRSLRHKVVAHLDPRFQHVDFVNAYLAPDSLDRFIEVASDLKKTFFKFCNYAQDNYPFARIRSQVKAVVDKME